jgi:hypothetical protein
LRIVQFQPECGDRGVVFLFRCGQGIAKSRESCGIAGFVQAQQFPRLLFQMIYVGAFR